MPEDSHRMRGARMGPRPRYPFEYFSAQLAFASIISNITGQPLWDAVATYTPFQEELIGDPSKKHHITLPGSAC